MKNIILIVAVASLQMMAVGSAYAMFPWTD